MNKRIFTFLLGVFIAYSTVVYALPVFQVVQGGTGATSLSGCIQGNGTGAFTSNGSPCGTGTPGGSSGQVQYNGSGTFAGVATSSLSAGIGISITGTPGALVGGTNITISASSFPFTLTTNFGLTVVSTSTPIWDTLGFMGSSTSQFAQASTTNIGSTGSAYFATSGGNVGVGTTSPYALLSIGNTNGIGFTTATSTFNSTGGINLQGGGCFSILGTCIGGGTVTSITAGTGLTGGTITNSGTIALDLTRSNAWTASATTTYTNGLQASYLSLTGTSATSTLANGLLLTGGCYALAGGVCIGPGGASGSGSSVGVNWATTVALPSNNYVNGVSGVGATIAEIGNGALSVDGNSPAVGDRILVKNETSSHNGIYTVTATGSAIATFLLTRAVDYDQPIDINPGMTTYVVSGTTNNDSTWAVNFTPPASFGSTALTYTETSNGVAVTSVTGTYPVQSSGGTTPAISLAFGTTTSNTWAGTQTFNNASTTRLSINNIAQYAFQTPGFGYATTTTWSATTTIALPSSFTNQTINSTQCYTDAGTLNVDIYHTTTHLTMFQASTTQNIYTFASNNTKTTSEKWYADIGTPASSPMKISCTFNLTPTGI